MIRLLSSQLTRNISRQLASITKRGEVYLTTGTGDSQSELRSLATQAAVPCPLVLINPRLLPIVLFHHSSHVHHYQNNVHFKTSSSSNKKRGLRYPLCFPYNAPNNTALEHFRDPNPISQTRDPRTTGGLHSQPTATTPALENYGPHTHQYHQGPSSSPPSACLAESAHTPHITSLPMYLLRPHRDQSPQPSRTRTGTAHRNLSDQNWRDVETPCSR